MIHHRIKAWPTWLRQLVWARQTSPESAQDDIQEEVLRDFASMPGELVFDHLSSGEHGISDTEALARRRIYGRNVVSPQSPSSCFILFLSIILNSFGILLIFLAIINAAIPTPNWKTFAVLMMMVLISCVVRLWHEYQSVYVLRD
ncbi:hypothetical protein CDV36_003868 [Fusarium kuroshium]|uniref:Cation-transporting P-type ATPase N-terminal domain-containing protein n=1 Tax=Fusarium kuroshium TaxID=2010991 RepID=A0A3M2SG27_9HYPO|nr:hypothetical protein CDV36_003868 [Fusarium kuroshium]